MAYKGIVISYDTLFCQFFQHWALNRMCGAAICYIESTDKDIALFFSLDFIYLFIFD